MKEINLSKFPKQQAKVESNSIRPSYLSNSAKKIQINEDKLSKQVFLPKIYDIAANAQHKKGHRRYNTDFTKDTGKKVEIGIQKGQFHQQIQSEAKSFDDLQIKQLNHDSRINLRKLSKSNPKSKLHKKLSHQQPLNFERELIQELQVSRKRKRCQQNNFQNSILQSQFEGRIHQEEIIFKPSLWKSYQFQKILRNRLKMLFKIKQKNHLNHSAIHAL